MLLPLILTFVISAQETSGLGPAEWVGLGNYTELISDGVFWRSLINTVGYAAVTVPLGLALGLAVAMLLNNAVWLRDVMRTIYYLPVVISGVAAGLIAQWMFNENIGVVNELLGLVGLGPVSWQSSPAWAMTSVVLLTLWVGVGFNMVVYLAALQGIPREYYDASAVDGANSVQQFRHVTLPGLGTATVFLAIYGVILSFQAFDLIYILTGGGPGSATEVLGTYAYDQAFSARERGYGSAIGVVLYLLLIAVLSVQFWISRRRDPEEGR
jgi:multiple sugar transport system permease protein